MLEPSNGSSKVEARHDGAQAAPTGDSPTRKVKALSDIYATCSFALHAADHVTYDTWLLVEPPFEKKILGLKWVFKTKFHANGSISKHKARLVGKGYLQELGIDIEDVYSPVARMETVRLVISIAAQLSWPVHHLDVKSPFLNGDVHEEVYVEQPLGY